MEELKNQAMTMTNSESLTARNVSQQLINEHSMPTKRRGFKRLGFEVVDDAVIGVSSTGESGVGAREGKSSSATVATATKGGGFGRSRLTLSRRRATSCERSVIECRKPKGTFRDPDCEEPADWTDCLEVARSPPWELRDDADRVEPSAA